MDHDFFNKPGSISDLAGRIAGLSADKRALLELKINKRGSRASAEPTIPRSANREFVPLSFAQQRLWFLDQYDPNSSVYNLHSAIRLKGRLNIDALKQTLEEMVRRHEALRTIFSTVEGEPVQIVTPPGSRALAVIDLRGRPESEREDEARRLAQEEARRPFDLAQGPVFRTTLIRLGEDDHVLLLAMHHIVSDGWSIGVLYRELAVLYEAFSRSQPSPLSELPIQYADYAVWQREWLKGAQLERQLSYWKKQLEGAPGVLNLPTDRPRPAVQSYRGARRSIELSKELTEGLRALGREEGATLFMTLLAAFQALLYRYTGQEDVVVGSPIANRNRTEIEGLIGFFVNTLALRADLSGNPTFQQLLARVRKAALGAYAHQDLPFEKLVEELRPERSLSHTPLFQVMFALQHAPNTTREFKGLSTGPVRIDGEAAKFDLTLFLYEEERGLRAALQYNTDLFDNATITRMLGHFQILLEGIVTNPEARLSNLPILTEVEKHQLLVEWNDTRRKYPKDQCIHQLFEAQVEKTPEAIALVFEDQQLTYRELNSRANQLAHYLQKLAVGPETLVAICVERSLEMIIGLLGILKAGGAYVPIDPEFPRERIEFMLDESLAPFLLTQARLDGLIPSFSGTRIALDRDWDEIARESVMNVSKQQTSNNLAYLLYTSGSTGTPKGVMVEHRSVINFLASMAHELGVTETDILLAVTSLSFDIAELEIYLPLTVGARVVLARREVAVDGVKLAKQLSDCGATVMQATPATWRMLLAAGWQGSRELKILCGGEALPEDLAERLVHRCGSLWNMYGPTETTVWSSVERVPANFAGVTLGRPIANTQVYILDPHLNPIPIGVAGELHIGGEGLARGYSNRPELSAERFIPNPFSSEPGARLYKTGDLARYLPDGNIEFLGRIDNQVKVHGFRIELGEIESVLAQHPAIQHAVVLAREYTPGDRRLVAYSVASAGTNPSAQDLRSFLRCKLPDYMIPSVFVMLDAPPLTPNGKIDRKALPIPDQARPELDESYRGPRNPIEEGLAEIWAKVLKLDKVGIRDNFFVLGGHSLLAVRLFAEIEKEFKKRLPLSSLFEEATIEHLAGLIKQSGPLTSRSCVVAIQPRGTKPPFFCVHEFFGDVLCYINLARHLGPEQPFYALQARGLDGVEEPFTEIKAMAAYYIEQIRTVQPHGPYGLGGLCSGGVVAFEMAQQLLLQGESVFLLALLDSGARSGNDKVAEPGFLGRFVRDFPSWLIGSFELTRSQWLGLVKLKLSRAKTRLAANFRLSPGSGPDSVSNLIKDMGDLFGFSEQHRKVALAQRRALRQYQPRIYPGRLTLFRARMQPLFSSHNPDKGWGQLAAGGLEIRVVPSNHLGMLQEPHVRVVAEQLRACLNDAGLASEKSSLSI